MKTRWKRFGVVASAMVLVGAVAAVASATGPNFGSSRFRYSACLQARTKTLSDVVINASASCSKGERQITWNAAGPRGATGAPGVAGATWTTGSTAPSSTTGQQDGDLFLDLANGEVYEDVGGAWVAQGSLQGHAGPPGVPGTAGPTGPAGTNGTNGVTYDCAATPYPGIDLAGCSLSDLSGANLTGANLAGATMGLLILEDTNFTGANLTGANLEGMTPLGPINFTGANLTDANLQFLPPGSPINFTDANLTGANLVGAVLQGDLTNANFTGANLTGALVAATSLTGVITTSSTTCTDGNPGPCSGSNLVS